MKQINELRSIYDQLNSRSISDNERLALFVAAKQHLKDIDPENSFSEHMILLTGRMEEDDQYSISCVRIIEQAIKYYSEKEDNN